MTERGLKGVSNPSALFLSQHAEAVAGSAIVATLEGSRPLLVEIQALVDPVQGGAPRRLAVGLDAQRLALLLAVLHRHGGVETGGYDVFVNAVGGVRIQEPAVDLSVLLAIDSSLKNRPLPAKSIVFGEVGLAGEIRPVQRGPGTHPRGGQARLQDGADPDRQQAEAGHRRRHDPDRGQGGRRARHRARTGVDRGSHR